MPLLTDDVGSFPLPSFVDKEAFDKAYVLARKAIVDRKDLRSEEFVFSHFYSVIADSFRKKMNAGLDVVNYPQHYDMHRQLADLLKVATAEGTYLIDRREALFPEVCVINEESKKLFEETGRKVKLRVCVLGPMEFYLREIGTSGYDDVLMMFAENARRFAENSLLDSKFVETAVVSLDEPSFGFREISVEKDVLLDVLEKAFDFKGAVKQVHLHSPSRMADMLQVKNVDVLSFEYAASPRNIESVSRSMLNRADKHVRVGIARTDIDSIMAELHEKGIFKPVAEQLVDDESVILKRLKVATEKYGDRLAYTGPDCGLGGWPTQEAAELVLRRTVDAVKNLRFDSRG